MIIAEISFNEKGENRWVNPGSSNLSTTDSQQLTLLYPLDMKQTPKPLNT